MQPAEIPEEFVYVPKGVFGYGGDQRAFQSMDWGEEELPGYLMSRREVTIGECLEFLNDENKLSIDLSSAPLWKRDPASGAWSALESYAHELPAFFVTHEFAEAYAAWKSRRDENGFRYRLPSDLEWEKAARGVDRRSFVWGNYLIWSHCWCKPLHDALGRFTSTRISPMDESVYGLRDLGGSLAEWTSGRPPRNINSFSWRGGSWIRQDELYFRVATRNSLPPDRTGSDLGFRLVAELPAER